MALIAGIAERGFGFGLLIAAFLFGFRHGIDWDHIAAITDITGSQEDRRQSMLFGTLYELGHATVVFELGSWGFGGGSGGPGGVSSPPRWTAMSPRSTAGPRTRR